MIDKIKFIISDEIFNKDINEEQISFIFLNSGSSRNINASRTICIAFIDGVPRIVVRWYQDPLSDRDFSKEFENQQKFSSKVDFSIPTPIKKIKINGRNILVENFLHGIPIERLLLGYSNDFQPQDAFLYAQKIQNSLNKLSILSSYDLLKNELEEIWQDFFTVFKPSVLEELLLKKTQERILQFFKNGRIIKRFSSGDFICKNILVDEDKNLRLVDYEFSEETHFYFLDWFRFIYYFPTKVDNLIFDLEDEFLNMAFNKTDEYSKVFWILFYIKDFLIRNSVFVKELVEIEKKDFLIRLSLVFENEELWKFIKENKVIKLEDELSFKNEQIQSIYASRTWKLGRIATAPWRWARSILKK